MFKRQVTYTFDGDTYVGSYQTTSFAGVQSVAVQLADKTISARTGKLSEEAVARTLLGELVRERIAEDARLMTQPSAVVRKASLPGEAIPVTS